MAYGKTKESAPGYSVHLTTKFAHHTPPGIALMSFNTNMSFCYLS